MNRKEFLLGHATKLLSEGLSVIAVDGHKKAISAWKMFTEDRITTTELERQINSDKANGIAIICGAISGNLEVIDFDLKHDITGDLMERYIKLIDPVLKNKLRIVKTSSGGYHWYYKCEVIEGNKKLASRPPTPEELKDTPHLKKLVLIETRGNNGYVVAPPSDGYEIEQANEIPVISVDERDSLLEAARSFMEIHNEERARFTSTGTPFVVSPFDDYNVKCDAVALLVRHGWTIESETGTKVQLKRPGTTTAKTSGNFHKDKNLLYVWTTSTEFYPEKAYSPAAIYTILVHGGDFSKASRQLISEGFGTRKTPESIKKALEIPYEKDFKFWDVSETKKGTKIDVSLTKLVNFIHAKGGFASYKYNEQAENIIVQVQDGFVREVEILDVKQFIKNEVLNLPDTFDGITPDELLEVVYREYTQYLSKNFMEYLDPANLDFLKDTKSEAYFPFRNGIVKITKGGCSFHTYGTLNKVIWRSQMIDKVIDLTDDLANKLDFENIDYCSFITKVSGEDTKRFEYFLSIIGYLLHKYKDPKAAFAVILAEETENEADGGGTGKGLFMKAIKHLIPTEIFDGKQFSPGKNFAFQRVSLDTKVIAIEDAKRGFKFEEMYSFITEGLPVEKKNQKEFFIPFEDSPKITVSTNYVISDEGNHAKRRQKVLEFSNFFSPSNTPFDFFGRMLFEDWDNEEYNRFYNFMFFCTQVYLEYGILNVDQTDTNKIKNIKLKYTEDLLLWFRNHVESTTSMDTTSNLYTEFIGAYGLAQKDYEKRRFVAGVRYIAGILGYAVEEGVKKTDSQTHRTLRIYKS
ncbi:MAG: bifunctional DNA primase/polymerase [Ferruginibacter sp.]